MRLKPEVETEVFINAHGEIVIKQQNCFGDDDNFACLSPEQFEKIRVWVDANKEEIIETWSNGIVANTTEGDFHEN